MWSDGAQPEPLDSRFCSEKHRVLPVVRLVDVGEASVDVDVWSGPEEGSRLQPLVLSRVPDLQRQSGRMIFTETRAGLIRICDITKNLWAESQSLSDASAVLQNGSSYTQNLYVKCSVPEHPFIVHQSYWKENVLHVSFIILITSPCLVSLKKNTLNVDFVLRRLFSIKTDSGSWNKPTFQSRTTVTWGSLLCGSSEVSSIFFVFLLKGFFHYDLDVRKRNRDVCM